MAIRITRNEAGNCITFVGSSNPVYWNSCLSAQVNESDSNLVDIINDIRSANEETIQYEFYAVDHVGFSDKDGNSFSSPQDMVDYVNENANVTGVSDTGADLTDVSVNFRLDDTSTSVIMDNGASFGVNTIKAVADIDGTIHIHAIGAGSPDGAEDANELKHFEKLVHTNVSVNGNAVAGGLQDVVNTLNELFTVGAFESVVISDPYSTMIADVDGVDAAGALAGNAVNPSNSDIAAGSSAHYNKAGWLSSDTIDQAGEYFTFDIRVEGIIGMGLVVNDAADINGNTTYGDPTRFCDGTTNSGYYGLQFGHFFHPSPNGPWTNYGANTGYVMGPGWSNATHRFAGSPEGADWLAGTPVKMRTGIDEMGFISIDYYDASESTWITCARTNYPTVSGVEYKLGIKLCDSNSRLASLPKIHLLEELAPTMNFRYIESPDGIYDHPVFATEEEANYYDLQNGGTGTSATDTYDDDPTYSTWYIPTNGFSDDQTVAPTGSTFMGNAINWTEVTSLTNADLTPSAFSGLDYSYEEGTAVNFQLLPAGATWTQSLSISPSGSGMVYNSATGYLQGTLTDVGADTTYTVTVTKANAYGSSVGTFEVVATNVAPVQTNNTPWTKALDFSGSNEYLRLVSGNNANSVLKMSGMGIAAGGNSTAGYTSNDYYARPWATSIVFKADGNNSNQYIWNSGEGTGSSHDNIYLRVDASNDLYFGWGRNGVRSVPDRNECKIATAISTSAWYGVYITSTGERLSSGDATAANLADCFDIRLMSTADSFASVGSNLSTSSNWVETGSSMTNNVVGMFTIGTQAGSRAFYGKVASMVVTTLKNNQVMPVDAEIKKMITDPQGWVADYKLGQTSMSSAGTGGSTFLFPSAVPTPNNYTAVRSTQVWLMGDGASDSYANGIRSYILPTDTGNVKMQLNSMVSNDIETVSIPGLT